MYEERKEKFSFKSFFLTLLLVLLFIFLMLWLFPTRSYVNTKFSDYDLDRLSVLYDEIFANNVYRMKEGAIGYFTNERMPQKVGESKKLTLQQMYDLHLVLKMKDKDGKACDVNKSYVEMTKFTEEYRLKVNLKCGEQEDYIIVYLGCYSYCSGGICQKTASTPSKTTIEEEKRIDPERYSCKVVAGKYYDKDGNSVSELEYNESCNIPSKKYKYEYKLTTKECTTCTDWSDWQEDKVDSSDSLKVETKTEKKLKGYKTITIQTGTKVEKITKTVTEKYIASYSTKLVLVGTKDIQTGNTTETVTEKVQVGTVEKYVSTDKGTRVPSDTADTVYKVISTDTPSTCSYCENETMYTWEVYSIEPVYDVITKEVTVPVYKTIKEYKEQNVPVYDYRTVDKEETVYTPIYEDRKIPEYENVTYYRFKTCKTTPSTTDIKWSYSKFDVDLIGAGYKLTGNVKEA